MRFEDYALYRSIYNVNLTVGICQPACVVVPNMNQSVPNSYFSRRKLQKKERAPSFQELLLSPCS